MEEFEVTNNDNLTEEWGEVAGPRPNLDPELAQGILSTFYATLGQVIRKPMVPAALHTELSKYLQVKVNS